MTSVTQSKPRRSPKPESIERALRADARRNREAIIAAAKKLFADEGLDAQMPDIAKQAGVGVGTVYRHFPTKDDLIAALAAEKHQRLAEKAREGLANEDPWEGLCEFIRFAARFQAEDRGLCEVVGSRPEVMEPSVQAAGLDKLADQLVKRAQRSGDLRKDLEWQDMPLIGCALAQASQTELGPATGRWPRLVEIILDGLRAPGRERLPKPLS
jgi:AcrR family transcriptional regulator